MSADKEEQQAQSVLLVDDLPANLELLAGMLKSKGYKTRAAVNGEAALQAVNTEKPDLILLDINMPDLNGYEVCERLHADEEFRDIPVIFLSALNETLDKVRAFGAGGVDYVSKPFQFEEVEARVRTHLELRRQKELLRRNYEKLKELEKLRDGLVHMMVHDLRSPLSVIISYLDFLKRDLKEAFTGDVAEDIGEARKAADAMLRLVSTMLDASKIESGSMKLSLAECDVPALLEQAAVAMKSLAGGRQLLVEPCAPIRARVDVELISRVVQNLVGNALKFAPREGGYVRLAAAPLPGGFRVTVENNGPDIPVGHQKEIFEKFGQLDAGGVRRPYSTGLGLNFCKLAVEAHGGRIGVESSPGKPTVFWFELKA